MPLIISDWELLDKTKKKMKCCFKISWYGLKCQFVIFTKITLTMADNVVKSRIITLDPKSD